MKIAFLSALLLLVITPLVQAQAYKCKQPNGAVSFQDQPCAKDAIGVALKLPPPEDAATAKARTQKRTAIEKSTNANAPQSGYEENQRLKAEEEMRAQNAKNDAYNRGVRCNQARRQLGITKEQTPIFSRDNKGEKQYVKDEDRAGIIARAQKSVDEECN